MKVSINEDGELIISPENALEIYALGKWADDNISCTELGKEELVAGNIVIMTKINEE